MSNVIELISEDDATPNDGKSAVSRLPVAGNGGQQSISSMMQRLYVFSFLKSELPVSLPMLKAHAVGLIQLQAGAEWPDNRRALVTAYSYATGWLIVRQGLAQ